MKSQKLGSKEIIIQNNSNLKVQNSLKNIGGRRKRSLIKGKSWHKQPIIQSQQNNYSQKLPHFNFNNPLEIKFSAFQPRITQKDNSINQFYSKRASDMILSRKQDIQRPQKSQISKQSKLQYSKHRSSKKLKTSTIVHKKDSLSLKIKLYQQSPYIGKKSNISKLIKMLKPVKGPNESIKKQILRHNDLNKKNHQLVLMRTFNQDFQHKRQRYLQRIGLASYQKVFLMNSRDHHIKQTLIKRGWVQLDDLSDGFFHLKWVYSDNSLDYQNLNRGQLFNHFHNNQQLTNKNNLRKNIKNAPAKDQPTIPLTYDLGYTQQYKKFKQKALKFQSFKILEAFVEYFKTQQTQYYYKILRNPNYFKFHNLIQVKEKKSNIIYLSYEFYFIKQKQKKDSNQRLSELQEQFIENILQLIEFIMKDIEKQTKIKYTVLRLIKIQDKKNKNIKNNNNIHSIFNYFSKIFLRRFQTFHFLKCLSNFIKVQIIKLHQHFLNLDDFQVKSYGSQNIWIVKPTGVSRGTGIYLQPDFQKLFNQTNSQHGRIVQKYIQKPFLLADRRKFDLRQWILVRKFQPFQAYIYKNLYGRICHQKYEQNDYQNIQKHLTNYAISKQLYLNKKSSLNVIQDTSPLFNHINIKRMQQKSIILDQDLKIYIQSLSNPTKKTNKLKIQKNTKIDKITWHEIKLKIKSQIIKTLKACSRNIQPNLNCFQVYGFDILLDQNLKPYIIQVNLSPACQKRQGLQNYLQQMSYGLIDYIQEWLGQSKKYNSDKQYSYQWLQKEFIWQPLQQIQIQQQLRQINEYKIKQKNAIIIQKWFRNIRKYKK